MPAPKSLRLHIGLFGRRNAGKSSLLNALTRQEVSIVSEVAGTTTDPVEKPMEMLPLGPVLWIDTAGLDDAGALGEKRMEKSRRIFDRTDVGILVVDAGRWDAFEEGILPELRGRNVPVVVVFNKSDIAKPQAAICERFRAEKVPVVETVANAGRGVPELREALIAAAPEEFLRPAPLVSDLVPPGEMAVLVVPIDTEAPKGRLIVPQVQTIRDLLDGDAYCLVVKERELRDALGRLSRPPALVVTDSQAFLKVSADTPPEVKMTSFSILFARQKGRPLPVRRRGAGHRAAAAGRPRAGGRGLHASPHRRRHRPGEDSPLAEAVRRRRFADRHGGGARFSRRSGRVSTGGSLRGVHVEPPRDAHPPGPLPPGRRADLQLRHDHRLHAGDIRPGVGPVSRRAGDVSRGEENGCNSDTP